MKDKLAEEILDEAHKISSAMPLSALQKHFTYLAMQRYHKARMKEVTDEDIEAWADGIADAGSLKDFERGEWLGIKEGARAFRDGGIKHNREV
jgi:uncharacterized phage-associated protein